MTLREIVYMIMDELKIMSDDSCFNEDHIKFLVNKYRIFLLFQAYKQVATEVPSSNYQTINVKLKQVTAIPELDNSRTYLRSVDKVPNTAMISTNRIYPKDISEYRMTYVNKDRFKFIGFNKWTKNIIYCTIIDNYIYLTSSNPQYSYLEELSFNGIFDDAEEAFLINNPDADVLDMEYPIEPSLVTGLIQAVVNELMPKITVPEDDANNATDDRGSFSNVQPQGAQ